MSRPKKTKTPKLRITDSDGAIPAWLFFLLLGILCAGVIYYKNNAGRPSATEVLLPSSSLSQLMPAPQSGTSATFPAGANPAATTAAGRLALLSSQGPFENLPGFPLNGLGEAQKKKFLDRVNSERCNCGCKGDTIARCLVKDPACQIAPAMANRVLAEVQASAH
jgi:hypothetical protein